jgi:hypothetical protein
MDGEESTDSLREPNADARLEVPSAAAIAVAIWEVSIMLLIEEL